jgi:hypothetical protein
LFNKDHVPEKSQKGLPGTNLQRFKAPNSPFLPPEIPCWAQALLSVDTSAGRLIVGVDRLVDFPIPDPHLMLSSGDKTLTYIVRYLGLRSVWRTIIVNKLQSRIINSDRIGFTSQQWRACLEPPSAPSSSSEQLTRTQQRKVAAINTLASQLAGAVLPNYVYWNGVEIISNDPTSAQLIAAEVIWDLYEHNFRIEVFLLDRAIMKDAWADESQAVEREKLLLLLFPGDTGYLVEWMPIANEGLAAESWIERCGYVRNFCKLLATWPNHPTALDRKLQASPSEKEVVEIEQMAVRFYCQTFFDYFARAPITPHRLPPVV